MREILFRGKRTDNGDWEYGDLWCNPYGKRVVCIVSPINDQGTTGGNEVNPETVGQYTGLKDKNGKKIFEGDIIGTDIARPYLIVEFRDGCFMFNCNDGGKDYYDIMLSILEEAQTEYKYGEVIGNIYDNPELLEGGE